jgi:hypothetical protein
VGEFNTPLSPIGHPDKTSTKKLQNSMFYHEPAKYTLFSAAHSTFSKIDHMLGHKPSFNMYKKIERFPCILSYHERMKLAFNNKRNNWKYQVT